MASDNSEEIEKLNESIRSLQESLAGLSQGISKTSTNMVEGSSKASRSLAESTKASEDAAKQATASLKSFGGSLFNAGKETGKALLDTSAGLSKYGGAVNAFGSAIGMASKSLGMLSGPVGLLVTVITKLVGNALEFSDNMVKAHDSLADMGATIGNSTDDLFAMGQKAGYSSERLGILTKNAASLDQGLVALGGSASKGVKAFSEIAAVTQETREGFRNLGFSQEQVTEMQATFVKQLTQTGGTLAKTPKQLQEESVKYIKELNVLSELTGVSAKKQQEAMDKALANENFNAFIHKKERERDAEADPIKKAALQAEIDKRKALAATIVATEGAASATGKLQALSSENGDIITEQTASLEAGGQSMRELVASTKDATKSSGEVVLQNMRAVGKATREFEDRVGEAGYAYGQASIETQKAYGIDNEARKLEAQTRNMSAEDAKKFAEETIRKQEEKEKTKDTNLAARNAAEEASIVAAREKEKALKQVNDGILQMFTKFMEGLKSSIEWLGKFVDKVKGWLGFKVDTSSESGSANSNTSSSGTQPSTSGGGTSSPSSKSALPAGVAPSAGGGRGGGYQSVSTNGASGSSPPTTGSADSSTTPSSGNTTAGVRPNLDVQIGDELRKGGTVSWRTNNPGNISFADITKKHGALAAFINPNGDAQQRSVGIAIMPTLEAGQDAQMDLWRRPLYNSRTIAGAVNMWTKGIKSEEPDGYSNDLAKAAGVDVTTPVKDLSDEQLRNLVKKQAVWEGYKSGQILKARDGGVFNGPESGYLVELHGEEKVEPVDKLRQMLDDSDKVSKQELSSPTTPAAAAPTASANPTVDVAVLMESMMTMMSEKLDTVIEKLSNSNDTQDKILTYSMV